MLLILFCIAPFGKTEPLSSSAQLVRLAELITLMNQLLDKTERFIELQEDIEEIQDRSFFRKVADYADQMEIIASLGGGTINGDNYALYLNEIDLAISGLQRAADRTSNLGNQRGLQSFIDSLIIIANTVRALNTTTRLLKEIPTLDDYNSQDQLLAGIHWSLTKMDADSSQERFGRNIRQLSNQQILRGSFNVFNSQ